MSASSSSEFAVEAIHDLLTGADATDWATAGDPPDRFGFLWDFDHNDRINYPDPALYLWSPVDTDISKFSADGDRMLEDNTVEIVVMTLDSLTTKQYERDVIQIISQYYDDNESDTEFYTIPPSNKSDLRNEHIPQQTDHYMSTVHVEPRKYQATK
jgi:hypothetical protein